MAGGALFCIIVGLLTPLITSNLPSTIAKLYGVTLIPYLWMFILASFISEYKDRFIPFLKKYWWIFIVLLCLNKYMIHKDFIIATYPLFNTIMLFAGLVGFAYAVPQINIKTDISYGVYIYHMTVVNALIALGHIGQSWTLWAVIFITCLLAWISTKTIGRISLKKKQVIA